MQDIGVVGACHLKITWLIVFYHWGGNSSVLHLKETSRCGSDSSCSFTVRPVNNHSCFLFIPPALCSPSRQLLLHSAYI